MTESPRNGTPVLDIQDGGISRDGRVLWQHLFLTVNPGEIIAVLGANGAGKSTLFHVLLGQTPLDDGDVMVLGEKARRGNPRIGYIPQQHLFPQGVPLRGRDLVRLGVEGTRFGIPFPSRATRMTVDALLETVGATPYANRPVGELSGGEQQRLRVAQALTGDPQLLLCDEPYSSLDTHYQDDITELIVRRRDEAGTAVMFITHDVNPILSHVDRVLFLARGTYMLGSPADVLTSASLTELFGVATQVVHVEDKVFIVGGDQGADHHAPAAGEKR